MKTPDDKTASSSGAMPGLVNSGNQTGLPLLRSWRSVYLFVLGCFVLWVVLLVMLTVFFP
jgi:hypothetical protein